MFSKHETFLWHIKQEYWYQIKPFLFKQEIRLLLRRHTLQLPKAAATAPTPARCRAKARAGAPRRSFWSFCWWQSRWRLSRSRSSTGRLSPSWENIGWIAEVLRTSTIRCSQDNTRRQIDTDPSSTNQTLSVMPTYVLLTKEYPFPQLQIIYFFVFKLSQLDTQVIHRLVSVFNPYLAHPLIPFSRFSRNYTDT